MSTVLWFCLGLAATAMMVMAAVSPRENRGANAADMFLLFFVLPFVQIWSVYLLGDWHDWTAWAISAGVVTVFFWLFGKRPWRRRAN